ncbi:L-xylulose reductase [Amphibalanus amphitrite]|uniref:L-xylulose reductase n=1 Tax=Amphibalanus amphitrite TaxID=1232801 RepID=A0A6A4VI95_AMPAM|nr:L-xylulose reductase-like [Amphibalanus amphitrite]XP_043220629.1 L-xylulose reductase-like [Amphibalanus amphitrite]XP_043220630.1 L-xylulose reductase-like [Amphibalanus amphitrite]KAF0292849.1 L-xylulose reductase [Amphibalanus amphitrite]
MEISLSGKRVLITGAGRGIGRALAIRVVACGGHVIALSRTEEHLDTLKDECPSVETVTCDLSDWEATREAVEAIEPVDCLVNNAGILILEPFLEATKEALDTMFDVNVKGAFNVAQVIARGMVERGQGGVIINMSSELGLRTVQGGSLYCASKAALDHLTRVMTLELGPKGIRVNCVNPTVVETDMTKSVREDQAMADWILTRIPMGRFATTEDVVSATMFLLSDHAALITGASLPVDGGALAR